MTVTFAEKLARLPEYTAGLPSADAAEKYGVAEITKLASNESPYPPNPAVVEAVAQAAAGINRYPDPAAKVLRRRLAEIHEVDPAQIAVSNGSCEILLAAAEALCEPGAEIVYAWPAFSIYPHLPALTGAREIRVPLIDGDVHDLDAMRTEITAATQLVIVCNPNNPTGTHLPAAEIGAFLEEVPQARDRDPRRGLRRLPDQRRPRGERRPAQVVPEPRPAAHVLQELRPRRPAGRLLDRADAVPPGGRRRAPAVQRQRARPGGGDRGPEPPRRPRRPRREDDRRARLRRGGRPRPRPPHARQPGQLLLDLPRGGSRRAGDHRRARRARRDRPRRHLARRPRPHPRHLRAPRRERALPRAPSPRCFEAPAGGRRGDHVGDCPLCPRAGRRLRAPARPRQAARRLLLREARAPAELPVSRRRHRRPRRGGEGQGGQGRPALGRARRRPGRAPRALVERPEREGQCRP